MADMKAPVGASFFATAVAHALFGFLTLFGLIVSFGAIGAFRRGEAEFAAVIMLMVVGGGLTAVGIGFWYAIFVVGAARTARAGHISGRSPEAPWLLNEAWARRQVVDRSSLAASVFLWLWSAGWWGACALIWSVNRDKILAAVTSSWSEAALAAFFLSCGLIGLGCAVAMTLKWWRYGTSTLHIDTLPGYLGKRFRGSITARIRESTPIEAEIACERVTVLWTRTHGGRSKELVPEALWSQCWPLERDRMTRTKDGAMIIPIDVALPGDKPPFELDEEGGGIRWVLYMRTDFEGAAKSGRTKPGAPKLERIAAQYLIPVYARR